MRVSYTLFQDLALLMGVRILLVKLLLLPRTNSVSYITSEKCSLLTNLHTFNSLAIVLIHFINRKE